jgi:hypothetical protein
MKCPLCNLDVPDVKQHLIKQHLIYGVKDGGHKRTSDEANAIIARSADELASKPPPWPYPFWVWP